MSNQGATIRTNARASESPSALPSPILSSLLPDVVTTNALRSRPSRQPDYRAESRALLQLAETMATTPEAVLDQVARLAMKLCNAGSAGVSVLEETDAGPVFRWQALAGAFAPYFAATMPRHFSPCGIVLDEHATVLMREPARAFPYIADLSAPVHEVLLVPFEQEGVVVGTVWVIAHDPGKHFDREDARVIGCLSHFASIAIQVLEVRHRSEAMIVQLQDAQARLEATLAAGLIGTWVWDAAREKLRPDTNLAAMFGMPDSSPRPVADYIARIVEDDQAHVAEKIKQALAQGSHYEVEYRIRQADGEYKTVIARGSVERDDSGKPISFPGVVIDITKQKLAEEELRQTSAENARLHAALVEADRHKDMFLAVLGHELRNPLHAISLNLQIINKQTAILGLDFPAREIIGRQVDHMVRLVNELTDLTRVSAGKLEMYKQNVALRRVLDAAIEMSQPQLIAHGQIVSVTLPGRSVSLLGDQARLAQVFSNLLTNAAKFSTAAGTIAVSGEIRGSEVIVRVRDFGIGIPPDRLDSIFKMFAQLGPTTPQRPGLGLGLMIARQIVEMHDGTIKAFSEGEGRGSEFVVTLPLAAPGEKRASH